MTNRLQSGQKDHVSHAYHSGSLPAGRGRACDGGAVLAINTGDNAAALAARQRLAPLLAGISDPFLRAICQLAMAWTLPITGDFDGGPAGGGGLPRSRTG